jgi:hypothetical protein
MPFTAQAKAAYERVPSHFAVKVRQPEGIVQSGSVGIGQGSDILGTGSILGNVGSVLPLFTRRVDGGCLPLILRRRASSAGLCACTRSMVIPMMQIADDADEPERASLMHYRPRSSIM